MTLSGLISLLVVDDHPLIRSGLAAIIAGQPDLRILDEAGDGAAAIELYRTHRPDIVLMDLRMPGMDGLTAIKRIRAEFPNARIIALSSYDGDEDIHRALAAGASGYLLKDMLRRDLLQFIRLVHSGHRGIPPAVASKLAEHMPRQELTPRELEVLAMLARGRSNPQIATALGRAESTMKVHVRSILRKLGTDDRTEAVMIAVRRGILPLE
jgi:DNA-binding NarL/FixJ family response regulator